MYVHFQWDDTCQVAYDHLKKMLADMVTLVYLDPNKEYVMVHLTFP